MHSYFQQAAALPSGAIAAAAHGGGGGGEGATTSSSVNGASLLQNALYGARSGSAAMHPGTALYRVLNAAPREKSLLASAVEDAFMSPDAEPVAVPAGADMMAVDSAPGGLAAEALADFRRHSGGVDGSHRVNLGVFNLAAADPMATVQQQPPTKAALYANYQQTRAPSVAAKAMYGSSRTVTTGAQAGAGDNGAGVQGLRRLTAAQLQQLSVVRQMQMRQQANTAAAQQQPASQTQAQQQAQVLAAAAEVAQQVAARSAAAAAAEQRQQQVQQQQQQQQQMQLRAAAAAAAAPASAAAANAGQPSQSAAMYNKRTAGAAESSASVLYKRPALGNAAAATTNAANIKGSTNAYVDYVDRHAATSAVAAVANEVLQRMGGASSRMAAGGADTAQPMAVSQAREESDSPSDDSQGTFLDCREDLGEELEAMASDVGSGGQSARDTSSGSSAGTLASSGASYASQSYGQKQRMGSAYAPYGPVYCPTVYTDVSSPAALALANDVMSRIRLPGGIRYMPVSTDSMLYYNGVHWSFSAFALALGSSYFQRLVEITPTLNAAVRHAPPFAAYAAYMRDAPEGGAVGGAGGGGAKNHSEEYLHKDGLRSILFTCAYLATKVVDRMPHTDMLRRILSMLYNVPVSREEAHSVELKCLEGLGYRLGPYFIHNLLEDAPPCCEIY